MHETNVHLFYTIHDDDEMNDPFFFLNLTRLEWLQADRSNMYNQAK